MSTETRRAEESADDEVREMVHRRLRRRRSWTLGLLAVLLLVGAGLVGAGVVRAQNDAPDRAPSRVPAGAAAQPAGLSSGAGPVTVEIYQDFLCPQCRQLAEALTPALRELRTDGDVTLVHHPVSYLDDRSSPSGYSSRAAAASGCASDAGRFDEYAAVLFNRQPAENGPGLSDQQLITAGQEAGITTADFADCVRTRPYAPWATYVSEVGASRGVAVTPTVKVDGERIEIGDDPARALTAAVAQAQR